MKDLTKRFTGALIYIVALLGGLYFRQPVWLFVCTLFLIVAMYEWSRIQETFDLSNPAVKNAAAKKNMYFLTSGIVLFVYLQFGLFFSSLAYGPGWNNFSILAGIGYYLFCGIAFREPVFSNKYIPGSFLYILIPFMFLYLLGMAIPPTYLLLLFSIIWVSDTFAYIGGRLFGRRKLLPAVSPKKTWEGAIIGVLFAGVSGMITAKFIFKFELYSIWFSIGVLVAIFGILGDLFESKIKRKHGIKDSGKLLPGHGGILDRMDSLLFALPIYYICVTILNIQAR